MNYDDAVKVHKIEVNVLDALKEYFGEAPWLTKPKDGQSPEEIKLEWGKSLGSYSESQLAIAVRVLIRTKKSMTFPTLAHLQEVLSSASPDEETETKTFYASPENRLRERNSKAGGRFFTTCDYRKILKYGLERKLPELISPEEYRAIELSEKQAVKPLFKKAEELGVFTDVEALWCEMKGLAKPVWDLAA